MFNLTLPFPYLLGATSFLTAGGLVWWCYWDKVSAITSLHGGKVLIAFTITTVLLGFIANRGLSAGKSNFATSMEARSNNDISCPTDDPNRYSTRERTRFQSYFPKVFGFPSSGGVLMLPLDIAVAGYLGIPRLEIVHRALDPVEEDAFCRRLRLLGAKWWESEYTRARKRFGMEKMTEEEEKEGITVGWPGKEVEGGVWILRTKANTAMLSMCLNMKERCDLLKSWGAIFYEDPREVEEFEGVF